MTNGLGRARTALPGPDAGCTRGTSDGILDPSDVALARLTGTHVRQIMRWKSEGGIPERAADRIACHVLGVHPSHVWSEWPR